MTDASAPTAASEPQAAGLACLGWTLLLFTVTALGCVGFGTVIGATAIDAELGRRRGELRQLEAVELRETEGVNALHDVALSLQQAWTVDREYPVTLPELPPADPWGTPIRYRRIDPDRAELRSAGPDRRFETGDDLVLRLPAD